MGLHGPAKGNGFIAGGNVVEAVIGVPKDGRRRDALILHVAKNEFLVVCGAGKFCLAGAGSLGFNSVNICERHDWLAGGLVIAAEAFSPFTLD